TWLDVPVGSTSEPLDFLLWFEFDEGWDVWIDGASISRERRRGLIPRAVSIPVKLAPGEHLVTVLVEDHIGTAAFGALLTGRDNGPPRPGLVDRVEPAEAKGPK